MPEFLVEIWEIQSYRLRVEAKSLGAAEDEASRILQESSPENAGAEYGDRWVDVMDAEPTSTRCPAVSAEFGPGNVSCGLEDGHKGSHSDGAGRDWFNLSEVIRDEDEDEAWERRRAQEGCHSLACPPECVECGGPDDCECYEHQESAKR
jgi:hypothetical protein